MSARFYSPGLGTFTQLDSVMGAAQNPLSMNRFLYALANPATLIDPTGHLACSAYNEDCMYQQAAIKRMVANIAKKQLAAKVTKGRISERDVESRSNRHRGRTNGQVTAARIAAAAKANLSKASRSAGWRRAETAMNHADIVERIEGAATQRADAAQLQCALIGCDSQGNPDPWANTRRSLSFGFGLLSGPGDVYEAGVMLGGRDPITGYELSPEDAGLTLAVWQATAGIVFLPAWSRRAGAAAPDIGFAPGTGIDVLDPKRLQHGTDNLVDAGVLPNWSGTRSPALIEEMLVPILENPSVTFDAALGPKEHQVKGFLGSSNGIPIATFVYKEGPFMGKLATSVVPSVNQLRKWGVIP